ncbi:putative SAP domain-containing protein [Seiridium cardinale]
MTMDLDTNQDVYSSSSEDDFENGSEDGSEDSRRNDRSSDDDYTDDPEIETIRKRGNKPAAGSAKTEETAEKKEITPGNGNFAKATRDRVKGREEIPADELEEFDKIKVTELKQKLKFKGLKVSGGKVELWNRLVGREEELEGPTKPEKTKKKSTEEKVDSEKPASDKVKIPGNGNFAKASQRRAAGREKVPRGELKQFDSTKVSDLKQWLKEAELAVSGTKVDLWFRWKEYEAAGPIDRAEQRTADETKAKHGSAGGEGLKDDGGSVRGEEGEGEGTGAEEEDSPRRPSKVKKGKEKSKRRGRSGSPGRGKRTKIHVVSGRSKPTREPGERRRHRHPRPTDYYIREYFLDLTLADALTENSSILDDGPPPVSHDITLRQYLKDNPDHRHRLAVDHRNNEGPFQNQEENINNWYDELQSGFMDMPFVDVLDRTAVLWSVWEDEERSRPGEIWENRLTDAGLDGFDPAFLDGRPFHEVVAQYPNFGYMILDEFDTSSLTALNPEDKEKLFEVLTNWEKDLKDWTPPPNPDPAPGMLGHKPRWE